MNTNFVASVGGENDFHNHFQDSVVPLMLKNEDRQNAIHHIFTLDEYCNKMKELNSQFEASLAKLL